MLPRPVQQTIAILKKMPGFGEKSARRLVFQLLQDRELARDLVIAVKNLGEQVTICNRCGNLTVNQPCDICCDSSRDRTLLCVVESLEDLCAIEMSGIFKGIYFNLSVDDSPLEERDVLPETTIRQLKAIIAEEPLKEIIVATNPRVEGDLTFYALQEALANCNVPLSRPAYGLPVGGSIEFADRVTLHAALERRRKVDEEGLF